jgi:hypothetical protein
LFLLAAKQSLSRQKKQKDRNFYEVKKGFFDLCYNSTKGIT